MDDVDWLKENLNEDFTHMCRGTQSLRGLAAQRDRSSNLNTIHRSQDSMTVI